MNKDDLNKVQALLEQETEGITNFCKSMNSGEKKVSKSLFAYQNLKNKDYTDIISVRGYQNETKIEVVGQNREEKVDPYTFIVDLIVFEGKEYKYGTRLFKGNFYKKSDAKKLISILINKGAELAGISEEAIEEMNVASEEIFAELGLTEELPEKENTIEDIIKDVKKGMKEEENQNESSYLKKDISIETNDLDVFKKEIIKAIKREVGDNHGIDISAAFDAFLNNA